LWSQNTQARTIVAAAQVVTMIAAAIRLVGCRGGSYPEFRHQWRGDEANRQHDTERQMMMSSR